MARRKAAPPPLTVRLSKEDMARLDRYTARRAKESPSGVLSVTRSFAIRELLEKALSAEGF